MELIRTIKALTAYVNSLTGLDDKNLGDAIKHLAEMKTSKP